MSSTSLAVKAENTEGIRKRREGGCLKKILVLLSQRCFPEFGLRNPAGNGVRGGAASGGTGRRILCAWKGLTCSSWGCFLGR